MSDRPRRVRIATGLGLALALAGVAFASVPAAEKIERAVAEANEAAGRAEPLLIDVALRVAGGGASAEGEIASHPTGLARLELRNPSGFVERHLLLGDEYTASRNGQLLERPHPFLPPVFLLQATSGAALGAALSSFGVVASDVELGYLGQHDCYVFGGRVRAAAARREPLRPSLWVDMRSFEPVRIVRADGTEYRLGPIRAFGRIRLPSWIDIESSALRARLDIVRAARADAPAAAFQADWLTAPPAESAAATR